MKKIINWGIIGTAKISQTALIPAIKNSKNSLLYALASRSKKKSTIFKKKYSIPNCYNNYKKLFEDPNVDIIYNPLPNHLHLKSTIEAANHQKHILLEKPITLKANEVDKLIATAKKNKIIIKEAFMIRYHPQWIWIKKFIKNKKIGKLQSISSVFSFFNNDPKNIRNIKKYGGGSLYDIGCYPILISRFLLDKEPKKVIATSKYDKNFKTDILTSAVLDFGGIHSTFSVSTQASLTQKVIIIGTKKSLIMENPFNTKKEKSSTVVIYNGKSIYNKDNLIKEFPPSDQYEKQVTNFSNHVLKKSKLDYNLDDAKKNMKVIDALFQSLKSNKWINL